MKISTINKFLRFFGLVLVLTIDIDDEGIHTPTTLHITTWRSYKRKMRGAVDLHSKR